MIRFLKLAVILAILVGGTVLLVPRNGDAGQDKPDLMILYTGDAVGYVEPCG